jgi:hypothetical protein
MARNGFVPAAYGLRIVGLGQTEALHVLGSPAWPQVTVSHDVGELSGAGYEVTEHHAVFSIPVAETELRLDRERREARYTTLRPLKTEEIVHPALAPVANVFARWDGRETLHAGAFVSGDGAWALLGDRGSGKSTTLAWLASQDIPVVADDIVVLEEGAALAGPRCIDMRDDAAAHLGIGIPASFPREGGRNRVDLPPIEARFPLRGFVYLQRGERTEVQRIEPAARLARLQPQRQVVRLHSDPLEQLDLAALPALLLTRRGGLDGLEEGGRALLDAVAG